MEAVLKEERVVAPWTVVWVSVSRPTHNQVDQVGVATIPSGVLSEVIS